jgi:ubiquinone/menaquinone biosynthesis C-methylase UbiE
MKGFEGERSLLAYRMRLSPQIGYTFDEVGRPIVYNFAKPGKAARISESTRQLLACFSATEALTVAQAGDTYCRFHPDGRSLHSRAEFTAIIRQLMQMGVLQSEQRAVSAYSDDMTGPYMRARAIPREIAEVITNAVRVGRKTKILDVATGTGSLALQLGRFSDQVTAIDVSEPFLAAARKHGAALGVKVDFKNSCANKLIFMRSSYDLVTIAQAFHWLDPVCACRGFYHVVRPEGNLVFVESNAVLPERHPIRTLYGYGKYSHESVQAAFQKQANEYPMWLDLLKANQRALRLTDRFLFRQERVFDADFARALFTPPQRCTKKGRISGEWKRLLDSLQSSSRSDLEGYRYWQVLRFRRDMVGTELDVECDPQVIDIV